MAVISQDNRSQGQKADVLSASPNAIPIEIRPLTPLNPDTIVRQFREGIEVKEVGVSGNKVVTALRIAASKAIDWSKKHMPSLWSKGVSVSELDMLAHRLFRAGSRPEWAQAIYTPQNEALIGQARTSMQRMTSLFQTGNSNGALQVAQELKPQLESLRGALPPLQVQRGNHRALDSVLDDLTTFIAQLSK